MKFLFVSLALVVSIVAEAPHSGYNYQKPAAPQVPTRAPAPPLIHSYPTATKISAPAPVAVSAPAPAPAPVQSSYIPPAEHQEVHHQPAPVRRPAPAPVSAPIPISAPAPVPVSAPAPVPAPIETVSRGSASASASASADNYAYNPPKQIPQIASSQPIVEAEPAHDLTEDGYQYKAVRRLKYRHRA